MRCDAELQKLTRYIHGFISGYRMEVDVIDARELDALRKQPLAEWLGMVSQSGCRIRGARGETARDIIELLENVRVQLGLSKQELARRSGLSRGHLSILLTAPDPNPTLETVVRLALGLGFALQVVDAEDRQFDDAEADGVGEPEPPHGGEEPREAGWEQRGAFGASVVGGSLLVLLARQRSAYVGAGLLGATGIGVGLCAKDPGLRRGALVVGAGILTGTLAVGLVRALQGPRG